MEDLGLRLQNETPKYESFSTSDLYIKIKSFNGALDDDLKYFDTFKEFLNSLDDYNYKINDLFMLFLYEYHSNDFCIDPKLDFNKLEKEIKTEIKTELNLRIIKYKKDIKRFNRKLRILKGLILNADLSIIKESYKLNESEYLKHKKMFKDELKSIKVHLK